MHVVAAEKVLEHSNYTGLRQGEDGAYYCYRNGILQENYTGLYEHSSNGRIYYIERGVWSSNYNGLYVHSINAKAYIINNGLWNRNYTGIYENAGVFYYIKNGIWQEKYDGLYEHSVNGNFYYLEGGVWKRGYEGVYKHSINGKYYYLKNGIWNTSFTGLFKHGGVYRYFQKGVMSGADAKASYVDSGSAILVSVAEQHLWYYKNGKLLLSTPVITGTPKSYPTPKGTRYVRGKDTNTRLIGPTWNVHVNYWMGIDSSGYYGIHDAKWKKYFGGDVYKKDGSHGCINLPLEAMKFIFTNTALWTKVVIY